MKHTLLRGACLLLGLLLIAGCAPTWKPEELERVESGSQPAPQNSDFQSALRSIGRVINASGEAEKIFFVQPTGDKSQSEGLPVEITDMIVSSVNQLAGSSVLHAPYAQMEAVLQKYDHPALVISGAISEFDQDIEVKASGINLNALITPEIEGEIVDFDLNAEFNKAENVSRIGIDFHLFDGSTGLYVPDVNCTNSILLYDIQKNRQWRFIIFGTGFTRWGKIQLKQGIHEGVRKLVDYSMLQLFGTYYNLPYWRTLGIDTPQQGREVLMDWRRRFLNQAQPQQILTIQRLLLKYPLNTVYVDGVMQDRNALAAEVGQFGPVTQAFCLKVLYRFAHDSPLIPAFENGGRGYDAQTLLGDLYMTLVHNVPMV